MKYIHMYTDLNVTVKEISVYQLKIRILVITAV